MKKGYYLWDWYGTRTIKFDGDIQFHCDEYAKKEDCFRRFEDAKKAGIAFLEYEIEIAQNRLNALRKLTVGDLKK